MADPRQKETSLVTLSINDLSFGYNSKPVLNGIQLEVKPEVTALIGPNAAGKTTLLKCVSGMLRGQGEILLDGRPLSTLSHKDLVHKIGYLPQEMPNDASLTVFEVVLIGRMNSLGWRVQARDLAPVMETLEILGICHLARQYLTQLSGGQRQMVSIAQALVRRPEVLVMDEPTNSLDIQHQLELFELIRYLTGTRRMTTITAMHDLNLAARFADTVVLLEKGQIASMGKASEVITTEMLEAVYGIKARVTIDGGGIPQIIPIRSANNRNHNIGG
jgi:iron complex transport system ATP-binding protein